VSFDELMNTWRWKPIRNCPGRFVLSNTAINPSLIEMVGEGVEISEFHVEAAKDAVMVVRLSEGGIISYKRQDGTFLHTLNTAEGFERKLRQLGIKLPARQALASR
jgi:hypothetical protein